MGDVEGSVSQGEMPVIWLLVLFAPRIPVVPLNCWL